MGLTSPVIHHYGISVSNSHKRFSRAKKDKSFPFESNRITLPDKQKKEWNRLLTACASHAMQFYCRGDSSGETVARIIKAPCYQNYNPAALSRPATDMYFGMDIKATINKEASEATATILRTAYAMGSGSMSLGYDQRGFKIYPWSEPFAALVAFANDQILETHPEWNQKEYRFNHVSCKIYHKFENSQGQCQAKRIRQHRDLEFSNFKPKVNNSQLPGSPVIIGTVGDRKFLGFRKYRSIWGTKKNRKGEKVEGWVEREIPSSRFFIEQKNGSCFLLHPHDEYYRSHQKTFWKHESWMQDPNSVCISFMLRLFKDS
ncbi:hypothetical protein SEMRO_776_G200890.1 [Seminavis robusta]|uniref:Uncharacterized protein n=1 Tax=Seminavis robusta TaxID=568900 RepID=A0A9N8HMW2_9STRA|nr:hypothetical protein SEMRO_776_G200890.1 [Seminavis robusta]|eukprot:Sro776_g200890.1 n/a (317) ;mRNA; f:16631-17581